MAQDITCQLVDRVKKGKYALQLDESTDILNSAQLLVFIRYSFDKKLNAVLLRAPEWTCTGEDIFTKLKEEGLSSEKLYWCVWGQDWSDAGEKERTESDSLTSGASCKLHTVLFTENLLQEKHLNQSLNIFLTLR